MAGFPDRMRQALLKWRFAQWLDIKGEHDRADEFRRRSRRQFQLIAPANSAEPCVIAAREVIVDGTRQLAPSTELLVIETGVTGMPPEEDCSVGQRERWSVQKTRLRCKN